MQVRENARLPPSPRSPLNTAITSPGNLAMLAMGVSREGQRRDTTGTTKILAPITTTVGRRSPPRTSVHLPLPSSREAEPRGACCPIGIFRQLCSARTTSASPASAPPIASATMPATTTSLILLGTSTILFSVVVVVPTAMVMAPVVTWLVEGERELMWRLWTRSGPSDLRWTGSRGSRMFLRFW